MKHEFIKIKSDNETRYVLESGSSGGTSTGNVATSSPALDGIQRRKPGQNLITQEDDKYAKISVPPTTPRNFVAKNAKTGGAGAHRDKKAELKRGKEKHKKPFIEQGAAGSLNELAPAGGEGGDNYGGDLRDILMGYIDKHYPELFDEFGKDMVDTVVSDMATMGMFGDIDTDNEDDLEDAVSQIMRHFDGEDVAEGSGISKDKETKFHAELDKLVHKTFGKRKGEMEGYNNPDHEISMASHELLSIIEDAKRLLKLIRRYSEIEGLEAWQQSKITKAADYLNSVLNNLQGKSLMHREDHSNFNNGWGQNSYNTYAGGHHGRGVAENQLSEKAPPGMEKDVLRLKKQYPGQPEKAFATAWMIYNRKHGKKDETVSEISDTTRQSYKQKAQAQVKELEPWTKKGEYRDIAKRAINRREKGLARVKEDAYIEELAAKMAEKLDPNADVDVWVQDFQKADPNKYHQFKNKTPEKKARMAVAARYAAKNPSKK